jgi:hypothetical protein
MKVLRLSGSNVLAAECLAGLYSDVVFRSHPEPIVALETQQKRLDWRQCYMSPIRTRQKRSVIVRTEKHHNWCLGVTCVISEQARYS